MPYAEMLSEENIEPALMGFMLAVHGQAVLLCKVKTGALRNSISIATELNEAGFNSQPGEAAPMEAKVKPPIHRKGNTAVIGSALPYARAKEEGRQDLPNYPAHPYLRPAVWAKKAQSLGEYSKYYRKSLKSWLKNQKYPYKDKKLP